MLIWCFILHLCTFVAESGKLVSTERIPATGYGEELNDYHNAAYSKKTNRLLFFGGAFEGDRYSNNVWSFNLDIN
jgi:hypothetical protein